MAQYYRVLFRITLLSFILMAPLLEHAQMAKPDPGVVFRYSFNTSRTQSFLEMKVIRFDESEVSFDYVLGDPSFSGSISFPGSSLKDGHHHAFPLMNGEKQFKNRNSMWLSEKLVREVQEGHAHTEAACCSTEWELLGREQITVEIDGKKAVLDVLHLKDNSDAEYWVLDDESNPFIVKAKIAWEMVLLSVDTGS